MDTYVCCDGMLHPICLGRNKCCKQTPYNPRMEDCCNEQPVKKSSMCTILADIRDRRCPFIRNSTHLCCYGNIYPDIENKKACCRGLPYTPSLELCCGGLIHRINFGFDKCCGTLPYNSASMTCLQPDKCLHSYRQLKYVLKLSEGNENEVHHHQCCGKTVYHPSVYKCRGGQLKTRINPEGIAAKLCSSNTGKL